MAHHRFETTLVLLMNENAVSRSGDALVQLGMGALVGKTGRGPQLQRAGALQDAGAICGIPTIALASGECARSSAYAARQSAASARRRLALWPKTRLANRAAHEIR